MIAFHDKGNLGSAVAAVVREGMGQLQVEELLTAKVAKKGR
jgi:hypothetical protein